MHPTKKRIWSDDRILESLRDHDRMVDVALRLEKGENSQMKEDFRKLFVQLGIVNSHRGTKQVHIIQHIASFIEWKDQWSKIRNVCKTWKHAIDSSRVDQIFFVDGAMRRQTWNFSPTFLRRFTRVKLTIGQLVRNQANLLQSIRNMKLIFIEWDRPESAIDSISHCALVDSLLEQSRDSLETIVVNVPYVLKGIFPNLKRFSHLHFIPSNMFLKSISSAKASGVRRIDIVFGSKDYLDQLGDFRIWEVTDGFSRLLNNQFSGCFVRSEDVVGTQMDPLRIDSLHINDLWNDPVLSNLDGVCKETLKFWKSDYGCVTVDYGHSELWELSHLMEDLKGLKSCFPRLEYLCLPSLEHTYSYFGCESQSAGMTKLSKELKIKCVTSQLREREQEEAEAYANKQTFVVLSRETWL